ncbi:hypothetical protein V6N11_026850 [Hibiscus sabdariffa]|uniref:Uncharacterized protein n=1 Tax=Hibiscus sabdariffa TaxID=183260 RepID=A0ABR2SX77_9ROSI
MLVNSSSSQVGAYDAGQWPNMQQQQQTSFFSAAGGQSTTQQFIPPVDGASANQNFAPLQNMLGAFEFISCSNTSYINKRKWKKGTTSGSIYFNLSCCWTRVANWPTIYDGVHNAI